MHGRSILFTRTFLISRSPTPDAERKGRSSPTRPHSPNTGIREPVYNIPTTGRAMIVKQLIEPLDPRRRVMLLPSKLPSSGPTEAQSSPLLTTHSAAGMGDAAATDGEAVPAFTEGCGSCVDSQSVRSVVVRLMPPRRPGGPPSQPVVPGDSDD